MSSGEEDSTTIQMGCGCTQCLWRGGGDGEESRRRLARAARSAEALAAVLAAEGAGTALLVALTCWAAAGAPSAAPLQRALTGGLVVSMLVQCFDHISGAMMNPTVTLAAVVRRRVPARTGLAMFAAQLAGAALGAAAMPLLAPAPALSTLPLATSCVTRPADTISPYKAVCVEGLAGGLLALANCASWDRRNRLLVDSWPLRVGLIVAVLILLAGDLTGASMNPARSFGPALCSGDFSHHWVYWVGPLGGALVFSTAYGVVWRAPGAAACRAEPARPCASAPRAAGPQPAGRPADDRGTLKPLP